MRKRLSLLMAMTSMVILVFALNLGVASAHPDASDGGTGNARGQIGVGSVGAGGENLGDPPAFSNEVAPNGGNGGIFGNPSTADTANGQNAMASQWLHSPVCSAHGALGVGPGHP